MTTEISSLMDGELAEEDVEPVLSLLRRHPEAAAQWRSYHLIGDSLRGMSSDGADFTLKFSARLAQEPTVLAPPSTKRKRPLIGLSMAATLAAVGFVAWAALKFSYPPPAVGPLASNGQPAATQLAEASIPAAGNGIDPYLLAHQESSPGMAIEGPAPYIRTVADTQ